MAAILIMLVGADDASWVNIVIMVPVLLLVGEVTPKTIAVTFPARFASQLTAPLLPKWIKLITPLLAPDEFQTLIEYGEADGALSATERVLINNMLDANQVEVVEIMTPRTRIQYLNTDKSVEEMIETFRQWKRPRVPVVENHKDNVIGMLHSEDVLKLVESGEDLSKLDIRSILQPARFVPPTKKIDQMFDYFQAHNTRVAIILSEDGGLVGLVTLRDVLMFTFGGISSSSQLDEILQHEGTFNLTGDMRLRDFNDMFHTDFHHPRTTTVAGLVFSLFGHLPQEGDSVGYQNLIFTVTKMVGLRIQSLQLTIKESSLTDDDEAKVKKVHPEEEAGMSMDALAAKEAKEAKTREEKATAEAADDDTENDGETAEKQDQADKSA